MIICLEQSANDLPQPPHHLCFNKIQNGLSFWYRPTQVVLEKRPLNDCVCVCVCVPTFFKQQHYRSIYPCSLSKPPNHHHCNDIFDNSRSTHGVFLYPTAYSRLLYDTVRANGEAKFLNGACSNATDRAEKSDNFFITNL